MKRIRTLLFFLLSGLLVLLPESGKSQDEVRMDYFGEGYQLVYFGVLEGLFQDGVKSKEVDLILKQTEDGIAYEHFIYACPICMATIHALELYRDRPRFYGIKDHAPPAKFRTFGKGLSEEVRVKLQDADSSVRLKAIHELVIRWVNARLESLELTEDQHQNLQAELKAGRERGMKMLRGYQKNPEELAFYAPAYADLKECAICNAALQMEFKTE